MTLLFVDGFDHYTTLNQKYEVVASAPTISAAAARTGGGGMVAAPSSGGPNLKMLGAANEHATLIVGAAFRRIGTPNVSHWLFSLYSDTGTTQHLSLLIDATGKLKVFRGNFVGTVLGSESGTSFAVINTWHYVALKATLSDTVGTVEVRVDGNVTPVMTLSGQDTKNAGTKSVFDSVAVAQDQSAQIHMDDFYICNGAGAVNNDFLGDIKIETLYPNADGANSALGPSTGTTHATLVDESPPNTSDYVAGSTNDTVDTWNYANTTVVGTVRGVQVNTFAQKSDSNPKSFRPVVRHAGTDYPGVDQALGIGFGYYRQLYETNPGTSAAWTTAQIDSAEFGAAVRP